MNAIIMIVIKWFLWLIAYSFIGWVYESIVRTVGERKLINSGFLNGPLCPVYGVGALVSIVFMYGRTDNVFLLFFTGMVLTCTVEYITSVLLEKLFNARWWDYSNYRFHINGRVSLLGAVVFGILSVLVIKFVHPFVAAQIDRIPEMTQIILSLILFTAVSLDLFVTVRHILTLNRRLQEIQSAINVFLDEYSKRAGEMKSTLLDKFEGSEFYNERIKTLIKRDRIKNLKLSKAFPKLRPIKYEEAWGKIKNLLSRQ